MNDLAENIINELELFKIDVKHHRLDKAEDRVVITKRWIEDLLRQVILNNRNSGEVK